jgi:hypothetical protein
MGGMWRPMTARPPDADDVQLDPVSNQGQSEHQELPDADESLWPARRALDRAFAEARSLGYSLDLSRSWLTPLSTAVLDTGETIPPREGFLVVFDVGNGQRASCNVRDDGTVDNFQLSRYPSFRGPAFDTSTPYSPSVVAVSITGGPASAPTKTMIGFAMTGDLAQIREATDYLGAESHTLCSGYVNFGLPMRLNLLHALLDQARAGLRSVPLPAETLKYLQWTGLIHVCMLAEDLCAFVAAVESWRAYGTPIGPTYLTWPGSIPATLGRRELHDAGYWQRMLLAFDPASVATAGLSPEEAAAFEALVDQSIARAVAGVGAAAAFMTPAVRRIYARYKHSSSLVSPLTNLIHLEGMILDPAPFYASLLVLDRNRDGKDDPVLLILECGEDDLLQTYEAAFSVANAMEVLVGTVLLQAEYPDHSRGIAISVDDPRHVDPIQQSANVKFHHPELRVSD